MHDMLLWKLLLQMDPLKLVACQCYNEWNEVTIFTVVKCLRLTYNCTFYSVWRQTINGHVGLLGWGSWMRCIKVTDISSLLRVVFRTQDQLSTSWSSLHGSRRRQLLERCQWQNILLFHDSRVLETSSICMINLSIRMHMHDDRVIHQFIEWFIVMSIS